jgi:hypothetical protein
MARGTTTRPRRSAQPKSPSIRTPRATGPEVVVTHQGGAAHSGVHPPDGLALLALDLSRVDGLAPPGQVERGSQ